MLYLWPVHYLCTCCNYKLSILCRSPHQPAADSFLISGEGYCKWYFHYLSKGHVCQCPARELLLLRTLATSGFMAWEILEDNGEFAPKLAVNMQMCNDSQDQ